MKQKIKKAISVLLAVLMILAMFSNTFTVYASDTDYSFSSGSGELIISTPAGVKAWEGEVSPADIKSLIIESAVTQITGNVFQGLINLESLVFEDTVEIQPATVGYETFVPFAETVKLETISFGGDVILGQNVFRYTQEKPNTALTELHFPGETNLAGFNFCYCNELLEVVFEENSVIQSGGSFSGVPKLNAIEFRGESQIDSGNFQNASNLETITFYEKTTIGAGLFYNCLKLKELTFPAGSSLGASVFVGNTALEEITFEGDVDLTAGIIFSGCTGLKTLVFNGESKLSSGAFSSSSNLESITFGEKTDIGSSVFTGNAKLKELTFPIGSTIGSGVFTGFTALETLTFEGDVDLTAGNIFSGCTGLKNLVFNGKSKIANSAFSSSSSGNLESITFRGKTDISGGIFSGNSKLKELTFPTGSTFGGSVFSSFTALETLTFEGDVDLTAGGIFSSTTALKTLIFNGESKISNGAFSSSSNLESITFGGKTAVSNGVFSGNSKLKELTIPAGSTFGPSVFGSFTALEALTFEGDVDLTAGGVFSNTTALKALIFNGESKISNGAFSSSSNLESITFGGKTEVSNGAFSGDSKVKELSFPAGSTFGTGVFIGNTELERVTFEGDVDLTAGGIFSSSTGLKTLVFNGESKLANGSFHSSVNLKEIYFAKKTELGANAFSSIGTALIHKTDIIVLPDGSTVDSYAFYGSNLSGIEFKALVPQSFNQDTIYECADGLVIYVPCVSIDAYETALNEGEYPANPHNFAIEAAHAIDTNQYITDENNHWNQCSNCDEHFSTEPHTAGDWITDVSATQTANGTKHKECIVCQYVMETGIIPAIGNSPQTGDNSNMLLWFALLFISVGAAIGTVVVSKKKKYSR